MSRLFTLPAGRRSKWVVFLVVFIVYGGVAGAYSSKFENAQKNETSSFLPGDAESVKALDAVKQYPGGEIAPAVIVYERNGGWDPRERNKPPPRPAETQTKPPPPRPPA